VARAARPRRRRGDSTADLQFLTVAQLDAVIDAIPDHEVHYEPARGITGSQRLDCDGEFRHRLDGCPADKRAP
jgi:hypothetical protein